MGMELERREPRLTATPHSFRLQNLTVCQTPRMGCGSVASKVTTASAILKSMAMGEKP